MADLDELKGKAQEAAAAAKPIADAVVEGAKGVAKAAEPLVGEAAGKVQEAFDTHARPVIDGVAEKAKPVVDDIAGKAKPVVEEVVAKVSEKAHEAGVDKAAGTVAHDVGNVFEAAKNKVEEATGKDLDGDGKIGA